jgi:hypothetical protein
LYRVCVYFFVILNFISFHQPLAQNAKFACLVRTCSVFFDESIEFQESWFLPSWLLMEHVVAVFSSSNRCCIVYCAHKCWILREDLYSIFNCYVVTIFFVCLESFLDLSALDIPSELTILEYHILILILTERSPWRFLGNHQLVKLITSIA